MIHHHIIIILRHSLFIILAGIIIIYLYIIKTRDKGRNIVTTSFIISQKLCIISSSSSFQLMPHHSQSAVKNTICPQGTLHKINKGEKSGGEVQTVLDLSKIGLLLQIIPEPSSSSKNVPASSDTHI